MAVTIRDVAERAEVSLATVSRALRNHPLIAERTRLHVVAVAAELGYVLPTREVRPHQEATRPRVALVVPYVGRWYFARLLEGAERVMQSRGIDLIVTRPVDSQGRQRAVADHLQELRVNGAIVAAIPMDAAELTILDGLSIPIVLVGSDDLRTTTVGIDDVHAGYVAASHLFELGHRRIGLVTEGPHPWGFLSSRERRNGFLAAHERAGVRFDPALEVHADFTVRGAQKAVEVLLEMPEPPTAIVVHSDEMAFGVMTAARLHGLRIPEDLSVVGIDDHELAAAWELTTVGQPVDTIGELAAWQMASRLAGLVTDEQHLLLPTTLIVRGSTAAIRKT